MNGDFLKMKKAAIIIFLLFTITHCLPANAKDTGAEMVDNCKTLILMSNDPNSRRLSNIDAAKFGVCSGYFSAARDAALVMGNSGMAICGKPTELEMIKDYIEKVEKSSDRGADIAYSYIWDLLRDYYVEGRCA